MILKLQDFENRLLSLDEKMGPIQENTSQLSMAKSNISLTFIEIEKTHDYFRLASELGHIINRGMTDNPIIFFDVCISLCVNVWSISLNHMCNNRHALYCLVLHQAVERIIVAKAYFSQHRGMKSSLTALTTIEALLKVTTYHTMYCLQYTVCIPCTLLGNITTHN